MSKTPLCLAMAFALCAAPVQAKKSKAAPEAAKPAPYASTYRPIASPPVLLRNATVLTGTGERLDDADVLMQDGKIQAVGKNLAAPQGALSVDATGKWITPGIIDTHSHLGVYPSPGIDSTGDGNEMTSPVTAEVWAEHSVCRLRQSIGRRRHQPADPSRLRQSDRRPQRHPEKCGRHHRTGHEIPRCAAWHQNGLWRESEAGLRQ